MNCFITPEGKYVIEINGYSDDNEHFYYFVEKNKLVTGLHTFDKEPKVFRRKIDNIIAYYTNATGEKMTTKDYNDKIIQLLSKKIDDDDIWETLEDEYNYKKFFNTWTTVLREEVIDTKMDLKWISHKKPDSKYILTSYYTGKDYFGSYAILKEKELVFDLTANILQKAGFICKDAGLLNKQPRKTYKLYDFEKEISIHFHSGYFKYVYGKFSTRGTLQEMEAAVKQITQEITKQLEAIINGEETIINGATILSNLKSIESNICSLRVYNKSDIDKTVILSSLRDLITEVENSLAKSV